MKYGIGSAFGRATLGATVVAVGLTVLSGPVAADEPTDTTTTTAPAETGVVDGAVVAVAAPPVPVAPETGVVDGAVVAVAAPPVPVAPETGVVDGAVVAVAAPPVPSTTPSTIARSAGAVAQRTMLGRLRATIIEQQIASAVADATAVVALELRAGR